ncbi:MAG: hypothetical protein MZV49_22670 [Rhodopseudomonas palustris]|nr:hypothetical protein [Rhodopseudomonas palustris]
MNHCAINVALYRENGNRWTMTERGRGHVERSATQLSIGPSRVFWDGSALNFEIDEVTAPIPSRIKGRVRVIPCAITQQAFTLNEERQSPLVADRAVLARRSRAGKAQAALERRRLFRHERRRRADRTRLYGVGMVAAPRCATAPRFCTRPSAATAAELDLALQFDKSGAMQMFEFPTLHPLPRTPWRVSTQRAQPERSRGGTHAGRLAVLCTLDDRHHAARRADHLDARKPVAGTVPDAGGAGDAAIPDAAARLRFDDYSVFQRSGIPVRVKGAR